ncbi:MAG: flagellar biosynthetic protein FliR [Pseudomonadota bacterium]|nr:flagellar biosynthetic protein FliR [Pseudomonadota bacterium]
MLQQFLTSQIFAFLLVFCRLGSAFVLLPGFGEIYVAVRARLMLALMFSLTLTPVVHNIPPVPTDAFALMTLMGGEILTGLFLGGLSRLLIAAMHIAATAIAYQSSLASALTLDIAQFQGQDTSLGNLMSVTAVVLLFATDLDHLMLKGLADSYTLFVPGQFPPIADFAQSATQTMNGAFRMALQLAAPNIVIGMILYLGGGIISRLMPTMQIFFIMMAPQLLISFFIIMVTFSAIMLWYINYFKDSLSVFLAP